MYQDTKPAGGKKNVNQKNNQPLSPQDWRNRYMDETKRLSIEEYQLLEDYRPVIRMGIQGATVDDKLRDYEHFEAKKECYEYELLIRLSRTFFSESPKLKAVKNWARKLTNIRKPSWYVAGIRQRESIQVMSGDHIFEYDDAGTIIATSLDNQDRISNHLS